MRLRWPIALATLAGLAAAFWAMGSVGLGALLHAIARMGGRGFLLFCIASLVLSLILGAAWWAAMPGQPLRRLGLFAWARTAREGANDLLPFSQVGGLVIGARALTRFGLPPARTYAAMVVDLTTEMASQAAITLFAVAAFGSILLGGGHRIGLAAWIGVAVSIALTTAFVVFQRPLLRVADRLVRTMLPDSPITLDRLHDELGAIYAHRSRVALSFLLNLAGWLFSSFLASLVLALIGTGVPLWRVIALESLISALRSAAFVIPGAIGVQEAGYALLGPLIGIAPEVALALSLLKRARDVTIGLPALLIWQALDLRTTPAVR